jgi:hypothetical protein
MNKQEAIELLSSCDRYELRDHAFGDCEVTWNKGEEMIASGYFSSDCKSVSIYAFQEVDTLFAGKDADDLRKHGRFIRSDIAGESRAHKRTSVARLDIGRRKKRKETK